MAVTSENPFGGLAQKASVFSLENVTVQFLKDGGEPNVVLQDFNLTVPDEEKGEFIALLGPSGCGKSTIMNLIGGMLKPNSGTVTSFGNKIEHGNPEAVTVQQAYTCFPWRSVQRNVEFGLEIRGISTEERAKVASEYLTKVGLGDRLSALPRELSGGMQQRVAIARCLALKPKIMLMDEPFGALDAKIREDMQRLLTDLWLAERQCVLFVTHDITEALLLADRVIVLSGRPATVLMDFQVPFPRPRIGVENGGMTLANSSEFMDMSRKILETLRGQGSHGQVRVSI